ADVFKNGLDTIDSGLEDFSEQLGISVPQAAVQQNVYSEAFIGKTFPAVPPHVAAGINGGFTHINTSGIAKAADVLGIGGVEDTYYFPVLNADIRIGGVFLPFDIGLSFMKLNLPEMELAGTNMDIDFTTFAIDARYAIFEDGLISPAVSVGIGYSMNSGSFGVGSKNAEAKVDYDVQTLYAQVQISKTLNIPVARIGFTPFAGLRGVVSSYENEYSWALKDSAINALGAATGVKTSNKKTVSTDGFDFGAIQTQVYGGVSFNFMLIQLTASACADLRNIGEDSLWSGALSLRIKL
ncbi:MAG: hypothetical protein KBT11_04625, partial [Treponema sp.]|nr:hypothetical protein [Candidatus Treponema equifaecale]